MCKKSVYPPVDLIQDASPEKAIMQELIRVLDIVVPDVLLHFLQAMV